ncbi:uncharacterized protein LOC132735416, partial [Ruditapes philippinarum]|uniref:uncharacterized protein LOC132735416 n=1 Tax=Ruditapes philippinarum TaxID=129788 RepID=UPI00295ADB39
FVLLEYSFSSLPILESNKTSSIEHQPVKITIRKVPATPESHPKLSAPKPKSITHNASGGSLDEQALSPPHPAEIQRRHSLAPPQTSSPPVISLTSEDTVDKKRRSSAQSLGPFSFSVSLFGDSRRSSLFSSDTRRSSERIRRPSTHSVGILPIASFGEGTEKPRKPSTHSLGILPLGWGEEYDGSPSRRPSVASLGPYWIHDSESRRGSRGSVFGSLGLSDGPAPQRRASFQALGESMMQLFSGK